MSDFDDSIRLDVLEQLIRIDLERSHSFKDNNRLPP